MKLGRYALSSVLLLLGAPLVSALGGVGNAEAGPIHLRAKHIGNVKYDEVSFVSGGAGGEDDTVASVSARIMSDAGSEELTLVETDAWLHGAASLSTLPATDAAVTLTLYSAYNVGLVSFSGTITANGTVSFSADTNDSADACDTLSRSDCTRSPTEGDASAPDVEVLASEVFATLDGFELTFDLAGADTDTVAYGSIAVTESRGSIADCASRSGDCGDPSETVITTTEVFWDDLGSVWTAVAGLAHEGPVEVRVKRLDTAGQEIDETKTRLGMPWITDGNGLNALATDEDPLTTLTYANYSPYTYSDMTGYIVNNLTKRLTVVSQGWSASGALPVDARVELTNGDTLTVPVNSYQRITPRRQTFFVSSFFDISYRQIVVDDGISTVVFEWPSREEPSAPVCSGGFCLVLRLNDLASTPDSVSEPLVGSSQWSVTAYGDDATTLPDEIQITDSLLDSEGVVVESETVEVAFDDEITAVFATEVSLSDDPIGVDLAGRVKLLGEMDRRGRQTTLAKGRFYGTFSRNAAGGLELAGADKDEVSAEGNIVMGDEAVLLTDREGAPLPPPAIQYLYGDIILGGMAIDFTR